MPYHLEELREQLISDPDLRIMFVEGAADLRLWRSLVSEDRRFGCAVYPISEVESATNRDNNRQRCLDLANISAGWDQADQLRFFIDADNLHILGHDIPNRVIVTDGRDLESYCLDADIFEAICVVGLGATQSSKEQSLLDIHECVRPIGVLRALSERDDLQLPFRRTFPDGAIKRVWGRSGASYSVQLSSIIIALLNTSCGTASGTQNIVASHQIMSADVSRLPDNMVVHGKDMTAFLSKKYSVDYNIVGGTIRLGLEASSNYLVRYDNISVAVKWLLNVID